MLAGVHDGDAVGDVPDHCQIVGDEKIGQAQFSLQILHEVDDLGPNRDIQGRIPVRRPR